MRVGETEERERKTRLRPRSVKTHVFTKLSRRQEIAIFTVSGFVPFECGFKSIFTVSGYSLFNTVTLRDQPPTLPLGIHCRDLWGFSN